MATDFHPRPRKTRVPKVPPTNGTAKFLRERAGRIAQLEAELTDLTDWLDMTLVGPHGRGDVGGWRKELGEIIDKARAKLGKK